MFPNPPNVDGLSPWLQVLISLSFVSGAIIAAYLGYRRKVGREPPGAAQTLVAAFPDLSAVRQLTDQCRVLCGYVDGLSADMRDQTHYLRNKIEIEQELCIKLRELKEEIVRSDQQRSRRRVSRQPDA